MDSSDSRGFNISEIYSRYCELRSGNVYACGKEGEIQDDKSQKATITREALAQLLRFVESTINSRISIFDEIQKLMVELDLTKDFSKFSRFYDFVFFMCREKGQKNITVMRAVTAWRFVLVGRFRLLNQWCDFVERIQRHNISEDTWQQVLSFSRCVHENLEGYDPEGAWPILIDEFVEHMYRISGSKAKAKANSKFFCNCGDSESQSTLEDSLPGLKIFPGLKRKVPEDMQVDDEEASDSPSRDSRGRMVNYKRGRQVSGTAAPADGCNELIRHNNNGGAAAAAAATCSPKSPCAVEGCLSKGFAGLFSSLQFDQERRVSFT